MSAALDSLNSLEFVSDELTEVLNAGDLDHDSRERLASLLRNISTYTTQFVAQPRVDSSGELRDSEEDWYRAWVHHVGSIDALRCEMDGRVHNVLYHARLCWLDELDAKTDGELLALPGFGRVALRELRDGLSAYYWRGEPSPSRAMWRRIADRLERDLEYRYLRERARVLDGVAFAECVLANDGASLADRSSPRMVS